MPPIKASILIVDDEPISIKYFKRCFENDYVIETATTADEAIAQLHAHPEICAVISDQVMPESSGIDLFKHLKKEHPRIVRIISTAYSDYDVVVDAINTAGVFAFLTKPWNLELVATVLANAILFFKAGNSSTALLQAGPIELTIKTEVQFQIEDLPYLQAVLPLLRNRSNNNNHSIRISTINKDKYVSVVDANSNIIEQINLSHAKDLLEGRRIDNNSSIYKELQNSLDLATNDHPPQSQVRPQTNQEHLFDISEGQWLQIKNTLDQVQIYLSSFLRQSSSHPRLSKNKSDKITYGRISRIQQLCREFITKRSIAPEDMNPILNLLQELLDSLNVENSSERNLIKKFPIETHTINALFISYNNLAALFHAPKILPDPGINQPDKSSIPQEDVILYILGLVIFLFPIAFILAMRIAPPNFLQEFMQLAKLTFLSILALICGIIGSKLTGRASLSGHLNIPFLGQNPLLAKVTGGGAFFFLIFIVGLYFI